jgi:hypothetical protein
MNDLSRVTARWQRSSLGGTPSTVDLEEEEDRDADDVLEEEVQDPKRSKALGGQSLFNGSQ